MVAEKSVGPLHGIRVVECGHMVGAAYATKLMADLGAEVVKVEAATAPDAGVRTPTISPTRKRAGCSCT